MEKITPHKPLILAADDELEILSLLQLMMPFHGYDVKISLSAENIFDIISESNPDIIFLDIQMGKIDGGVLCALLKSNQSTAKIPVLMISGHDQISAISKNCGADGYLKKPFSTEDIDRKLFELVGPRNAA